MFQVADVGSYSPWSAVGNAASGLTSGALDQYYKQKQLGLQAAAQGFFPAHTFGDPKTQGDQSTSQPPTSTSGMFTGPSNPIGIQLPPPGQPLNSQGSGIGLRLHDPNQPGDTTGDPNHPFVNSQSIAAGFGGMNAIAANQAATRAITGTDLTGTGGQGGMRSMQGERFPQQPQSQVQPQAPSTSDAGQPKLQITPAMLAAFSQQQGQGGQQAAGQGQDTTQPQTSATGQAGGQGGASQGQGGDVLSQLGQAMSNYQPRAYTIPSGPWKGSQFAPGARAEPEMYQQLMRAMTQFGLLDQRGLQRAQQIAQQGDQYGPNGVRTQGGIAKNVGSAYGEVAPHVAQGVGIAAGSEPYKAALKLAPGWINPIQKEQLDLALDQFGLHQAQFGNTVAQDQSENLKELTHSENTYQQFLQPALQAVQSGASDAPQALKSAMINYFQYADASPQMRQGLVNLGLKPTGDVGTRYAADVEQWLSGVTDPKIIQGMAQLAGSIHTGNIATMKRTLESAGQAAPESIPFLQSIGDHFQVPLDFNAPNAGGSGVGDPAAKLQAQYQAALKRGVDPKTAQAVLDREMAKLKSSK